MHDDEQDLRSTRVHVVSILAYAGHCDMLLEPSCHRSLKPLPKSYELVYKEGQCEHAQKTSCKGLVKVHDVKLVYKKHKRDVVLYILIA